MNLLCFLFFESNEFLLNQNWRFFSAWSNGLFFFGHKKISYGTSALNLITVMISALNEFFYRLNVSKRLLMDDLRGVHQKLNLLSPQADFIIFCVMKFSKKKLSIPSSQISFFLRFLFWEKILIFNLFIFWFFSLI